ncbi:hypothetical protein PRIPAC_85562 [Pristionchus pacificus]|nr:hypothetical protein PRIPAC_85562 [Pristionchus pacificus]
MVRRTPRNKLTIDEAKAETKEVNMEESGGSSANDSSDEEMEAPELMVTSRSRRDGAGAKMQVLLQSANMEDDFYKDAYGGAFNEDDQDDIFQSPVHSDDDVVDSDFDKSEEEDDPASDDDGKDGGTRRSKRIKGREERDDRKKKWVIARMGVRLDGMR